LLRAPPPGSTLFPYTTLFRSVVGVLGYRSAAKYAGIAGVVLSGRTYLPLHTTLSPEHTARMIALAGCNLLLVCPESADALEDLRSEEHTSELQSRENLVCRLL